MKGPPVIDGSARSGHWKVGSDPFIGWLTLASNKCQLNDSGVVAVLALSCHRSTSGRLLDASTV